MPNRRDVEVRVSLSFSYPVHCVGGGMVDRRSTVRGRVCTAREKAPR